MFGSQQGYMMITSALTNSEGTRTNTAVHEERTAGQLSIKQKDLQVTAPKPRATYTTQLLRSARREKTAKERNTAKLQIHLWTDRAGDTPVALEQEP